MIQKSYNDSPSLYLIPTPIGNLDDITVRSLNVLKMVDEVLCEDTRDTGLLLSHYDIKKKLVSCHEFNENKMIDYVVSRLKEGMNLGLVTDQGTPIISDPGYIVSRGVIDAGYNVISLPGATAFVPALTSSGLEPSPFLFYGFLNAKDSKQIQELNALKDYPFTIIFYEAVHRISHTLENLLSVFGNRSICICRELSKIHEEYTRGTIEEVLPLVDSMKGEFVLVVEGNHEKFNYSNLDIVEHVQMYLDEMSEMDAIKKVAKERDVPKSVIYQEYHNRK
ncbi:MAG: 16S rRNA (cytidine(1402)-2'-O)-methyltransferase [Bacilli bacterium]|nr:16S rRNA (cytidine(1402)-2'-O)-methyltransferase [Bacilli bacterium]